MFALLSPHITLALGSLALLMYGAFSNDAKGTAFLTAITFAITLFFMAFQPFSGVAFGVGGGDFLLQISPFTSMAGLLTVVAAMATLPLFGAFFKGAEHKPELYVLLTLSTIGAVVLVSASSLATLYVALELMSFPLYILAAFMRDDAKSSEAGLKYFILGSLASGLMLFGISITYIALGSVHFAGIAAALHSAQPSTLVLVGVVLTLVGTLFKLSTVPFHMWTPDVYEGAPTPVTAVMSALPKMAAFALLIRLLNGPFASLMPSWQLGLAGVAAVSMLGGSIMAVIQTNLKRLLAWSTIANVGFVMVGVVAGNAVGAGSVLFYLMVYGLSCIGLFALVIHTQATTVQDLKALATTKPWLAASFLVLLFSLAGIPPFAGFMAKLGVFGAVIAAGWNTLAIIGVVASVIASFYSLWLIKVMYFDAATIPTSTLNTAPLSTGLSLLLAGILAVTIVLGVLPGLLNNLTLAAANALY